MGFKTNQSYLENLGAQINTSLKSKGFVAIGEIARGHDLPGDFVIEKLLPFLDAQINSQFSFQALFYCL